MISSTKGVKCQVQSKAFDAMILSREPRNPRRTRQPPLALTSGNWPRHVLEALLADEYRAGRITKPDLRRFLDLETSDQIDTFLKAHHVWIDYTLADLARQRESLQRLGL